MAKQYLFAYGLLRGEFESPMADLMKQQACRIGPAKLRAQLFDIGGYPGVIKPNTDNQTVLGELFEVPNPQQLWPRLDAFEGISSDQAQPYEYDRALADVTTENGVVVSAWVYWYNWPLEDKVRICSGDYLQRVASTGRYGRQAPAASDS